MDDERRIAERRKAGQEKARAMVAEDRRQSDRRSQQMWEDAFDPTKKDVLGPDQSEPVSFDDWEKLAEEDIVKHGGGRLTPGYPPSKLQQFVFGDEFDDRREAEVRATRRPARTIGSMFPDDTDIEIPVGAKERVLGGVKRDIALQGLNRRVKGYGVAGTLADIAAAYSMAEGTPMERGYEAAKAGLKGAAAGAVMQGAINVTGKLGSIAGRGIPLVGAGIGAWNIGKAARGLVDWQSAERGAERERLASEAKWGNEALAKRTRHSSVLGTEPDEINRMTDRYGRWSPYRIPSHEATYLPSDESITDKLKEF